MIGIAVRIAITQPNIVRPLTSRLIGSLSNDDDDDGNETSFQNITSRFRNSFAIIPICLTWKMLASCPGSKLLWTMLKQRKRKKNLPSCVHVLERTQNLVISRCCFEEDGKEMYQNVKRTCRVLLWLINPIILWRSRCRRRRRRRRRRGLSSLLTIDDINGKGSASKQWDKGPVIIYVEGGGREKRMRGVKAVLDWLEGVGG